MPVTKLQVTSKAKGTLKEHDRGGNNSILSILPAAASFANRSSEVLNDVQ